MLSSMPFWFPPHTYLNPSSGLHLETHHMLVPNLFLSPNTVFNLIALPNTLTTANWSTPIRDLFPSPTSSFSPSPSPAPNFSLNRSQNLLLHS